MLRKWKKLPEFMKNDEIRPYHEILFKKGLSLRFKRIFDFVLSALMLIILFPIFLIIAVLIKIDSKGPIFYRPVRVTQYGKKFKIFKFRTMIDNADKVGSKVTINKDSRITRVGDKIRKYRIDEIPQLINILKGEMTFVGTRPESDYYVKFYTNEMNATLLLPAGVTSIASIEYKDEAKLLKNTENIDEIYVKKILPEKMKYNLKSLREYSFLGDIKTMIRTVIAVVK